MSNGRAGSGSQSTEAGHNSRCEIGSILLGSADPKALRAWYERAFEVVADIDGFLQFGGVDLLITGRNDVARRSPEPGRLIINLHVPDARVITQHLNAIGVPWLVPLEYREPDGAWFGTVIDPDGNYVQIIELTEAYWVARRQRQRHAGLGALAAGSVATRLPAQDLDRARRFYGEKLGLQPIESRPGGLRYHCGNGSFALFESTGRPSGEHTQMSWQVDDVRAVVAELRNRGVVFEEVDLPGLRTVDGIAEVAGNYPSLGGRGELAAWFRDSEGNLLGIGQALAAD
jgi:catechol 2,3-dioxygenase-like lactoylglutathione lyase family enzyme